MKDSMPEGQRAAATELLFQITRVWAEKDRLKKIRAEIDEQIEALSSRSNDCWAGFRAIGLDISDDAVWKRVLDELHPAIIERQRIERDTEAHNVEIESSSIAPSVVDVSLPPAKPSMPSVISIIIDCLRAAGASGTKAAAIREYIQNTYGQDIHEKTVGMTLYRLSQKGRVRREGHTWFYVPTIAESVVFETKNPGVGTPGSTSTGQT